MHKCSAVRSAASAAGVRAAAPGPAAAVAWRKALPAFMSETIRVITHPL